MTRDQVDEYYLTVAEVAELLRLNQQTVRNWIDQGSLPALRVGRRVRIKRSDLDRLLSEGYRTGSRPGSVDDGPSAEDFWGGEPVGVAEPAPSGAQPQPRVDPQRSGELVSPGVQPDAASSASLANGSDPPASAEPDANGADYANRLEPTTSADGTR